jgi:hypothetical protein
MKKGKTRTRNARANLLRTNAANARRKARQQARSYDRQAYDKPQTVDPSPT